MAGLAKLGKYAGTYFANAAREGMRAYNSGQGVGGAVASAGRGFVTSEGAQHLGGWVLKHLPHDFSAVRSAASAPGKIGAAVKEVGRSASEIAQTSSLVGLKGAKVGAVLVGMDEMHREAGMLDRHAEHPEHEGGMLHKAEQALGAGVKNYVNPAMESVFGKSRGGDLARMAGTGALAAGAMMLGGKGIMPARAALAASMSMGIAGVDPLMRAYGRFQAGGGFADPIGGITKATGLTRAQTSIAAGAAAAPLVGLALKKAPGLARAAGLTRAIGGTAAGGAAKLPAAAKAAFAERQAATGVKQLAPAKPGAAKREATGKVKEHQRILKSGKTITVREHARAPRPSSPGAA